MINTKLITRIFKVACLIGLILMLMNSCNDSNPMTMEEPCCVTPPYHEVMSMEQNTMMPGELPQPMIVGGYPVNPACPNCKYDFMVSPVSQVLPFSYKKEFPTHINNKKMNNYLDWMKSCYLFSATSLPCLSVPSGFSKNGLPIGTQFIGKIGYDDQLLNFGSIFVGSVLGRICCLLLRCVAVVLLLFFFRIFISFFLTA